MDLLKSLEEEVRRYAASLWGCTDEHYAAAISDTSSRINAELSSDGPPEDLSKSITSQVEESFKDSDDEEIVFIPRMRTVTVDDTQNNKNKSKVKEVYIPVIEPPMQKPVFEALAEDPGASFGRWLVHSIALYYGLKSWSVTQGRNPVMRIAFVGAQPGEKKKRKAGQLIVQREKRLPRPLWMLL